MRRRAVAAMAMLAVGVALLAGVVWAYDALITRPLSWPRVAAHVVSSRVVNPTNPTEHRREIVFELSDQGCPRRITTVASWSSSGLG
jgi:hypothetical protein